MNRSDSGDEHELSSTLRNKFGKKTVGGVAVVALVAVYSFIQPALNAQLGWNLPALRQDSSGQIVADSGTQTRQSETAAKRADAPTKTPQPAGEKAATNGDANSAAPKTTKGPVSDHVRRSQTQQANGTRGSPQATASDNNLRYGLLREVGRNRYLSPAGLEYGPGSQEGHRLEHLKRHTEDLPNRKGSHGVFDGDMAGALKTIDLAYERAKKGQRTTKQQDRDRTIYTVDMGKRVGFIGGETGKRKRNPMVRRVRLVVEGNYVITAYPL